MIFFISKRYKMPDDIKEKNMRKRLQSILLVGVVINVTSGAAFISDQLTAKDLNEGTFYHVIANGSDAQFLGTSIAAVTEDTHNGLFRQVESEECLEDLIWVQPRMAADPQNIFGLANCISGKSLTDEERRLEERKKGKVIPDKNRQRRTEEGLEREQSQNSLIPATPTLPNSLLMPSDAAGAQKRKELMGGTSRSLSLLHSAI